MSRNGSLKPGDSLAAVDLGSNSFHMVVARYELGGLRVIDRLRDPVRLAMGLRADGSLDPEFHRRALVGLARFGERLRGLPSENVRAVATNTVRRMRNQRAFLLTAETALGHPIEVVSGREEARLIYAGVAHGIPASRAKRLVVDIGGGSTEFIIGRGLTALETESIQIGCIATTLRFFEDGRITRKRWEAARDEIEAELQQFAPHYRAVGWRQSIGSSGTARALRDIGAELGYGERITRASLADIRDRIVDGGSVAKLKLPGLSEDRRPVITGGALILETVFRALDIERMRVAETALREGLLYDRHGRAEDHDPREESIAVLARRHGVDAAQAARVEASAMALFAQLAGAWELSATHRDWLSWAARMHEIGLAIAHSLHHEHGAYLVAHSDLYGFTHQEQSALAFLVRAQRRAIPLDLLNALPERIARRAGRVVVMLRLAALLHRGRSAAPLPEIRAHAEGETLRLELPRAWLEGHPLTGTDLETERKHLAALGIKLSVTAT